MTGCDSPLVNTSRRPVNNALISRPDASISRNTSCKRSCWPCSTMRSPANAKEAIDARGCMVSW
ncbi:hypothetical protein D3C81_2165600 [compost metagenome]